MELLPAEAVAVATAVASGSGGGGARASHGNLGRVQIEMHLPRVNNLFAFTGLPIEDVMLAPLPAMPFPRTQNALVSSAFCRGEVSVRRLENDGSELVQRRTRREKANFFEEMLLADDQAFFQCCFFFFLFGPQRDAY